VWAVTSGGNSHHTVPLSGTDIVSAFSQALRARLPSPSPSGTNAERRTPNASRNPLARFGERIEGDGEDDNDADNDLLNVGRHIH
jgi:hypothetical protein